MEKTKVLKALKDAFCQANRIDECFTCFAWKGAQVLLDASPMDLEMKHDDVLVAWPLVMDLCSSDDKTGMDVEQTHERITITVRFDSQILCHVKMYKKKTQLKDLVDAICKRKGWQNHVDVSFNTWCRSPINGLLTPEDYDIEDGDEILAYDLKEILRSDFAARLGVGWCHRCSTCDFDEWYLPVSCRGPLACCTSFIMVSLQRPDVIEHVFHAYHVAFSSYSYSVVPDTRK